MKFMDLLFSKYASPFILLDQMISSGRFFEFVLQFIDLENERIEYDFWLHRVFDKSFEDFKKAIEPKQELPAENLETTISESKNILANFIPAKGVNDGTI